MHNLIYFNIFIYIYNLIIPFQLILLGNLTAIKITLLYCVIILKIYNYVKLNYDFFLIILLLMIFFSIVVDVVNACGGEGDGEIARSTTAVSLIQ